jgi:hypothetical protein
MGCNTGGKGAFWPESAVMATGMRDEGRRRQCRFRPLPSYSEINASTGPPFCNTGGKLREILTLYGVALQGCNMPLVDS